MSSSLVSQKPPKVQKNEVALTLRWLLFLQSILVPTIPVRLSWNLSIPPHFFLLLHSKNKSSHLLVMQS